MTFFNNAEWIGYLAETIIQRCIALTEAQCSGCRDNVKCSILHLHNQLSLLEKIQNHFEVSRGEMLHMLPELYQDIEQRLPHSDDKAKDKIIYLNIGRIFLITCSPQALYYGRYVNDTNDAFINEIMEQRRKKTKQRRKTSA